MRAPGFSRLSGNRAQGRLGSARCEGTQTILASYTLPSPSGFFAALRMTQVMYQTSGFFGRRRDLQDEHTSIPGLKGETWGTRVLSAFGEPRSGKARQREKRRDPDELASYTLPSPSGFFAALRMTQVMFQTSGFFGRRRDLQGDSS